MLAAADETLKAIYRALAEGRITDDQAGAAEAAVYGRRVDRGRMITSPPASRPATSCRRASGRGRKREKVFGIGRPRALDRNAKVRIMHLARCLSRRTERGRAYGAVTGKALAVLEAILWGFHNAASGLCFPSYERIAEAAHCARSTVAEAIVALEAAGVLSWVNRLKRIREAIPGLPGVGATRVRIVRTSNAYAFNDPGTPAGRPDSSKSEKPTGTGNQVFPFLFTGCATAEKRLGEGSVEGSR